MKRTKWIAIFLSLPVTRRHWQSKLYNRIPSTQMTDCILIITFSSPLLANAELDSTSRANRDRLHFLFVDRIISRWMNFHSPHSHYKFVQIRIKLLVARCHSLALTSHSPNHSRNSPSTSPLNELKKKKERKDRKREITHWSELNEWRWHAWRKKLNLFP